MKDMECKIIGLFTLALVFITINVVQRQEMYKALVGSKTELYVQIHAMVINVEVDAVCSRQELLSGTGQRENGSFDLDKFFVGRAETLS